MDKNNMKMKKNSVCMEENLVKMDFFFMDTTTPLQLRPALLQAQDCGVGQLAWALPLAWAIHTT